MLNDTLELNTAAKLYNKCQTDVNNHSNKCNGPNLIVTILRILIITGVAPFNNVALPSNHPPV
jgi:hypothetical protein